MSLKFDDATGEVYFPDEKAEHRMNQSERNLANVNVGLIVPLGTIRLQPVGFDFKEIKTNAMSLCYRIPGEMVRVLDLLRGHEGGL